MKPLLEHRFVAEILRDGAAPVTSGELRVDWVPALEWGLLQRRRGGDVVQHSAQRARLCPAWNGALGAPYVAHLDLYLAEAHAYAQQIPVQYFASAVRHAVTVLVEEGKVNEGDEYRWRICAYPAARPSQPERAETGFTVHETGNCAPLPLLHGLPALLASARRDGTETAEAGSTDIPVLVAPAVLREAQASAMAAGTLEAGGILLGRLERDAEAGDLVLQVSAQVPAREAIADDESLRFTADTWKAVHAAVKLRRADEQIVGWWHSHPAALWSCRQCPPERRAVCTANRAFFSAMDVGFHRTAFPAAHQVALLLSFLDDPAPRFDLFGWRRGLVRARGFHTLEACT